jgi:DNA end-binding protein Ku
VLVQHVRRKLRDARVPGELEMRSIWKGHIRFLLVAIPVRIYNAIETSEKIQFNQLHRDDYGPIGYDKRCKKCGQVVTQDQITKGYQYEPDRYAIVEPEDIAKVKIKTTKAVDIIGFVDSSEIATTFYDSPYYAGPDGPVSEKPYALLREVMKQTGKIGIGKVVLRDREDMVAVFPHENGLVLQKLRYPHEIRSIKDVPELEGATKLDKNELKLATTLVEQMVTSLAEIDTVDQYHEALRKLIDSKIKGKKVVEFEVEELPRLDIMSALKKSLQASNRKPMVKAMTTAAKKKPLTLVKTEAKPKAARKRKAS